MSINPNVFRYNAQKNPDRNKVMKINERWEELKEESNANIQSEKGILKRQTRSRKPLNRWSTSCNPEQGDFAS